MHFFRHEWQQQFLQRPQNDNRFGLFSSSILANRTRAKEIHILRGLESTSISCNRIDGVQERLRRIHESLIVGKQVQQECLQWGDQCLKTRHDFSWWGIYAEDDQKPHQLVYYFNELVPRLNTQKFFARKLGQPSDENLQEFPSSLTAFYWQEAIHELFVHANQSEQVEHKLNVIGKFRVSLCQQGDCQFFQLDKDLLPSASGSSGKDWEERSF
mmetsp:Transcript_113376/g.218261  ORF Transcript_113376/g.218261 Transcript_113376/m.218261 type:complete len:214 (-) Transcript_113376:3700-4341(-)